MQLEMACDRPFLSFLDGASSGRIGAVTFSEGAASPPAHSSFAILPSLLHVANHHDIDCEYSLIR
jgi:hypothetical protein